jgi:hypothetical protein
LRDLRSAFDRLAERAPAVSSEPAAKRAARRQRSAKKPTAASRQAKEVEGGDQD